MARVPHPRPGPASRGIRCSHGSSAAGVDGGLLLEDAAGPAAAAGVQSGDLLLAVKGTPVRNIDQVRALVEKADKSIALLIERGGDRIFVPLRIG